MSDDRFDPSGYLVFDLARGRAVVPQDAGALVLPTEILERLAAESDAGMPGRLARALGEWLGGRLRARLAGGGADPVAASPEAFLSELNGLLAMHGLGRATIETYGDAMLLRPAPTVFAKSGAGAFLEALFGGVFGAYLGHDTPCLALEAPGGPCVLIASPAAIRRATQLRTAGVAPETIATRLHQEARALREGQR
jgi:hypothetical protein